MQIINKIFNEPTVFENSNFQVVYDEYRICPNHILAFSKKQHKGFNSHSLDEANDLIESVKDYYNQEFYFFERGNASFCTSIDGPICSHLHFVPKENFTDNTLSDLVALTKADLLEQDVALPETTKEYFFFGDSNNKYFSILNSKPQKRFLRNFFKTNCHV